ncbi:hypothetical protein [uncultured Ramlibacter sp.]|uniref:hypothetical protein n=1 Tax=uncultured Ramlibacter sp. TaxID=260755 RepID=UPI0026131873|nr:hypothetical protein [uncultured Ramlibacter sp.]
MPRTVPRLAASLLFLLSAAASVQPAAAQGFWDRLLGRNPQTAPGGVVILPGGVVNTGAYILDRRDNLPLGRNNVVVFVGSGCPLCLGAVEDVRAGAVAGMEVMDVSAGGMARDAFNMLGLPAVPATVAGSQMLVGRDPLQLHGVLGRAGLWAPKSNGP